MAPKLMYESQGGHESGAQKGQKFSGTVSPNYMEKLNGRALSKWLAGETRLSSTLTRYAIARQRR
jgi:hypothetical protein